MAIQLYKVYTYAYDVYRDLEEAALFLFCLEGGFFEPNRKFDVLTGAHASFTNDFAAHLSSMAISYSLWFSFCCLEVQYSNLVSLAQYT